MHASEPRAPAGPAHDRRSFHRPATHETKTLTEFHKRSSKTSRNQQKRVAAHFEKRRTPEENKRLKQQRRERDAERGKQGRRRGEWFDADGEARTFEKIQPAHGGSRKEPTPGVDSRAPAPEDPGAAAQPEGRVIAVARGRVQVAHLAHAGITLDLRLDADLAAVQQTAVAVGDLVRWEGRGEGARVNHVLPRRTVLARPDPGNSHRKRVLAANVDVAVLVLSVRRPAFKPGLADRFLVALAGSGVDAVIVANKTDLLEHRDDREPIRQALAPFVALGVPALLASAESGEGLAELAAQLAGRTSVFVGHSGVGKSSLLNGLDPEGRRTVRSGRDGDGKGRHTTTSSSLTELPDGSRVIDTPGVRAFGLWHLDRRALREAFPELVEHGAGCRFGDCSHLVEPGCAVRAAVDHGTLPASRYEAYVRISSSLGDA